MELWNFPSMTYDEALAFWYGRINFEVRSAGPADLKLERMRALLRRLGAPEDIADLVCYLSGPAAGYITGQVIAVDGGMTA